MQPAGATELEAYRSLKGTAHLPIRIPAFFAHTRRSSMMNPPRFAHRYLADGRIDVICVNCFAVVCNVQVGEDTGPFLDTHACESAELSAPGLPPRSSS